MSDSANRLSARERERRTRACYGAFETSPVSVAPPRVPAREVLFDSAMSDASEELCLGGEPDATPSADSLDSEVSVHTWLDGAELGLRTHGSKYTGAVYILPEEEFYCSCSCLRVYACARRSDKDVQRGSINVLQDAQWQAACALAPPAPLPGDSRRCYFNEAYDAYTLRPAAQSSVLWRAACTRPSAMWVAQ